MALKKIEVSFKQVVCNVIFQWGWPKFIPNEDGFNCNHVIKKIVTYNQLLKIKVLEIIYVYENNFFKAY